MTIEELKEELEKVEQANFYLEMKDYWSQDDYSLSYKYFKQIMSLKRQIKEMEGEE